MSSNPQQRDHIAMRIFSFFENLISATAVPSTSGMPSKLAAFYWHFLRQIRGLLALLILAGFAVAVLDASIPAFLGRLVTLISSHSRGTLLKESWRELAGMTFLLVVARPVALFIQTLLSRQAIAPGLGNLIRWQSYWHVVRQNWTFFQNDFAGAVANRVVETGPALRETVLLAANAVWYIAVYGGSAVLLMASSDIRLTYPVILWFVGYVLLLWYFVPRIRARSRKVSMVRSTLTGRVVDCYANIAMVKLYSKQSDEDDFIRLAIDQHTESYRQHLRLTTALSVSISVLNAVMIFSASASAIWLWTNGAILLGAIAMTLPLTWQLANVAGWVAQNATALFENMGAVEDGIRSIAVSHESEDRPNAKILKVSGGRIEFENVLFGYTYAKPVLRGANLSIKAGERVGLIGESGAGKSTLVHLLLRLFELDGGNISIDGQDIANVTLESLWRQTAMVTQDTSLLNRSIRDNIGLGKRDFTDDEIKDVAMRVRALDFIEALEDPEGNRGLDAIVGDRGVRLSGGQRQRIAIARAMLKNSPILILDEATSALDSEAEAIIQEQLDELMKGRTVLAIAHRASTVARMDRIILLKQGRITELNRAEWVATH
jgi:ATP-binding cassette subfamily B multidrug efflux pump